MRDRIEIIAVTAIIPIMAALIVPRVVGHIDDARIAATRQDNAAPTNALKRCRLDDGSRCR
jgi:general secretion pathway protein G